MTEQKSTVWIVIRDDDSWIDGVYNHRDDAKEYAKSHITGGRLREDYGETEPRSISYTDDDETILVERHEVH